MLHTLRPLFRHGLIWLLALVLPLHVASATAMIGPAHLAAADAGTAAATTPPCHEGAVESSAVKHAKPACSACSACCVMVALPTVLPPWTATSPSPVLAPAADTAIFEFVTDGPRRPPKPIAALS